MSIRVCAAGYIDSTPDGLSMAPAWNRRIVAEAFTGSTRDGEVQRAPDPVTFIESSMLWVNTTGMPQAVTVHVIRAPRSIVTSDPNAVVLRDGVSWDIAASPAALPPELGSLGESGGRIQFSKTTWNTQFGRLFIDEDRQTYVVELGAVEPGQAVHVRYRCAVQTPGLWREGVQPRHEAFARWVRLRMWAGPVTEEVLVL